mmetsp:Transcript_1944/g.5878  ORF Transcript_1944/g.5878 Transcript_1944/m.5878 type:complete len:233 (+) Transcript_1944:3-701(+)
MVAWMWRSCDREHATSHINPIKTNGRSKLDCDLRDAITLTPTSLLLVLDAAANELFSAALGVLSLAAIVPETHLYHAPRTAKFAKLAMFPQGRPLLGCIYALHFAVLFDVILNVFPDLSAAFKADHVALSTRLVQTTAPFSLAYGISTVLRQCIDPTISASRITSSTPTCDLNGPEGRQPLLRRQDWLCAVLSHSDRLNIATHIPPRVAKLPSRNCRRHEGARCSTCHQTSP